jgi:hypothetical protein
VTPHPIGTLVEHPGCPEWGPGRVLLVEGAVITVYFRDAPEVRAGDALKRLDATRVALTRAASQEDGWLAGAWLTAGGRPAWTRPRLTVGQAVDGFLGQYPGGFGDPAYLAAPASGARPGRAEAAGAHLAWARSLGHGEDRRLMKLRSIDLFRSRLLAVVEPLTLLTAGEKTVLREGLVEPTRAGRLFAALTDLLGAARPERAAWEAYAGSVAACPGLGPGQVDPWPLLTLLPFLAQPDRHLFVRPGVTGEGAQRLAFDLGDGSVGWPVYERLLALGRLLLARLEPHGARDLIDVHAFLAQGVPGPGRASRGPRAASRRTGQTA